MNSPALSLNQVIIVFFAFVALIVFISVIKKIHYRYILGKRYYIFPRVSAKGIANISMIISITVAIIILLTIVTAGTMGILFKAYPGARILIEGILINIGGLLFGPVIGLFIGGLTDLLTVLLTAGMFHYGYFVAAIAFGLFGGLVRTCLNISKHNNLKFLLLSSLMLIVAAVIICLNLYFDKTENNSFGGSMFGINVDISKNVIIYCFIGFFAFVLVFAWTILFFNSKWQFKLWYNEMKFDLLYNLKFKRLLKKMKHRKHIQFYADKILNLTIKNEIKITHFNNVIGGLKSKVNNEKHIIGKFFIPCLMISVISQSLISMCLLPLSDAYFGGGLPYTWWVLVRAITLIPMIILNLLIIYPIYKIIKKNITYRYYDDSSEPL